MSLGGAVQQRPTVDVNSQYTDTPMCRRAGCDRPATLVWIERTTGETLAYCAEDGVEAFNLVTRWAREPEQRLILEQHKADVERAISGGLYGLEPGRLYRRIPGES